jgi:DUF4097 and DUF4098 domain-containing protein YvlB
MATIPPNMPPGPPAGPPPGYDPREQRRWYRDQARAQRAAWKAQRMHMRWQFRSMRRGSVLGPLVLIAIGVVFLLIQTGRIDRNEFFTLYAHWWPLLLVGAGLIVLAEWVLDQFLMRDPEHPQYRRSIGGGGVILMLSFLVFIGILVDTGLAFHRNGEGLILRSMNFDQDSWEALFGEKHEYDQTLDLAAPANGTLNINNPRGDVTVTGTSGDGQIHIMEHKTIYAGSDSDAENRAQQMAPKTVSDGPETRVSVHGVDGAHADLTITVPPGDAMTINVDRGDIHVSSINAAVNATTNHGSVELAAITGPASVDINSGGSLSAHNLANGLSFHGRVGDDTLADITGPVSLDGDVFGTTEIERINGTVHFHSSRTNLQLVRLDGEYAIHGADLSLERAEGPVTLVTSEHNISFDRVAGDISITNRNGSVELTAAPTSGNQIGNVTIENHNGSVKTTLPEHAGFVVQATTTNGDIDSNLVFASGGQRDEDHNEKTVNGVVGPSSDAPTVHIRTANGDVSIMKGDVQPLAPPTPPAKTATAPPAPAAPKTAATKTPKAAATPPAPAAQSF